MYQLTYPAFLLRTAAATRRGSCGYLPTPSSPFHPPRSSTHASSTSSVLSNSWSSPYLRGTLQSKMSESVTEIAYAPMKKDVNLESGDCKSIWNDTLKTIASQKGLKRLSWGTQIESPSIAQMAIGKFSYHPTVTRTPLLNYCRMGVSRRTQGFHCLRCIRTVPGPSSPYPGRFTASLPCQTSRPIPGIRDTSL